MHTCVYMRIFVMFQDVYVCVGVENMRLLHENDTMECMSKRIYDSLQCIVIANRYHVKSIPKAIYIHICDLVI